MFTGSIWKGLVDWASTDMVRPGFELAIAEDLQIPRCMDNTEEALAVMRAHHVRWRTAQGQETWAGYRLHLEDPRV